MISYDCQCVYVSCHQSFPKAFRSEMPILGMRHQHLRRMSGKYQEQTTRQLFLSLTSCCTNCTVLLNGLRVHLQTPQFVRRPWIAKRQCSLQRSCTGRYLQRWKKPAQVYQKANWNRAQHHKIRADGKLFTGIWWMNSWMVAPALLTLTVSQIEPASSHAHDTWKW